MRLGRFKQPLRVLAPESLFFRPAGQTRSLHKTRAAHEIPEPKPFIPDVTTFLTLIGRGLSKHASKFPSWESLWSLTGPQLQELGIEPARSRKYLLHWMQKYRKGYLGPGGDFRFVENGQARLRIALSPTAPHKAKVVVNVPFDKETKVEDLENVDTLVRPRSYTVRGLRAIKGPYAIPDGETGSIVKLTEGMWEDKRGRKIDGGERRRAEVRFKKRSAERRTERESEIMSTF